jgi:alcohol dehydrogenase
MQAKFSFAQSILVSEEKTIKGSYMGSCVPVRDIPRFIALYQQGRLPVDRMVSQRVSLDELNEGFDRLQAVATVRQLLVPHLRH